MIFLVLISLCVLLLVFILISVFYDRLGFFVYFHGDWKFWHNIIKNKDKITLVKEINTEDNDIFIFKLEDIQIKYNFTKKTTNIIGEDILIPKYINNKLVKILDNYLITNYHY